MPETVAFRPVADVAAVPSEGLLGVEVEGVAVCLARTGGDVTAFLDSCPHRGTPLSQGTLRGGVVTCAAHTWQFDVRTGALQHLRAPACLTMLPTRVRGGRVEVAL